MMTGASANAPSTGLLARKGAARPAMRRQAQASAGRLGEKDFFSGWTSAGADDDLGWNDMGNDASAGSAIAGFAIGLTPVGHTADAMSVHDALGEGDWNDGDEESIAPAPSLNMSSKEAAPVATLDDITPADVDQAHEQGNPSASSSPEPMGTPRQEPRIVVEQGGGFMARLKAAWRHLLTAAMGRNIVAVALDDDLLKRLRQRAAVEGVREGTMAAKAVAIYLEAVPVPASGDEG